MKQKNDVSREDISSYKEYFELNGLEIWYIYLVCQAALKDKKGRKKLGINVDVVKNLYKMMSAEVKLIEE